MVYNHLTYKHMQKSDMSAITHYVSNEAVSKYLTWKAYDDMKLIEQYVSQAARKNSYPDEVLVIKYGEVLIGTVHLIERPGRAIQFGFGILPSYWGKSLGLQIITDMKIHIRNTDWGVNCVVIWADVHKDNHWAQNQLAEQGFSSDKNEVEPNRYRFILSV